MTHPNYTRDLLKNSSRGELHEICTLLSIPRRRSKEDCITDILAAQPQKIQKLEVGKTYKFTAMSGHPTKKYVGHRDKRYWFQELGEVESWLSDSDSLDDVVEEDEQAISAQAELKAPIEQRNDQQPTNLPAVGDTHFIGSFLLRCAQVNSEYAVVWDVLDEKNVVMGEARMGWDCFWTHTMSLNTFATPRETIVDLRRSLQAFVEQDEAVAFEKIAEGRWEAIANGVLVRITLEANQYKCNLADTVFTDYELAVKGSLVAAARVQEERLLERTERANTINVLQQNGNEFVVNNRDNGNHYIVRPNHPEVNQRCECADCHYRSVKCKHQIAVEKFLSSSLESAVTLSFDDLLDKPFDELSLADWEQMREPEFELVAA